MAQRGGATRKDADARKRAAPKREGENAALTRAIAFGVHLFTASGAACALCAMMAAVRADWVAMFAWLGLALAIDGFDGTLARYFRVAEILPRWSGDALDLVVDFTTYVFVPAYALVASGMLPDAVALALGAAIVISAAIYCADRDMKLPDNSFRGFPVLWNAIVFHLFILQLSPWVVAAVVATFVLLTFAPYRTIHPLRVPHTRIVNALALLAWSALAFYALLSNLQPGFWAVTALTIIGIYFLAAGLLFPPQPNPER